MSTLPAAHDVSVVICTYSEARSSDLAAAIQSVEKQRDPPAEIVVVVDHNPDLLVRLRTSQARVKVVPNEGARGLSGARNSGIAAAVGGIIVFLDDDAVAQPGWLAGLVAPYADPEVAAVGGSAMPAWDPGRPAWFPPEFDWVVGCSYVGMPTKTAAVRNVIGCNMSFRRSVFDTIGGFRSEIGRVGSLPVGCEETELCIRATRARPDTRIVYVPAARVCHRVPPARGTVRYFLSRCYREGESKAIVSALVGPGAGLSTERSYALRTLPRGIVREIGDWLRWRRAASVARAAMIPLGFEATSLGYVVGLLRLSLRPNERPASAAR